MVMLGELLLRIVYLLNNDDQYGAPKSTLRMIEVLKNSYGVIPIVITPFRNNNNVWCDDNKIENYAIPYMNTTGKKNGNIFRNKIKKIISLFFDWFFFVRIRSKINFNKVDFIHSSVAGITSGFYLASKLNIKHIWHMREVPTTWYYLRKNQIVKINSAPKTKLIAISNSVENEWISNGIDPRKIVRIYNGIDKNTISVRNETEHFDIIKIIVAGNLVEYKQPDVAIRAIGKLPKDLKKVVKVDFYGSADKKYKNYLEQLINKYDIKEQICFKGYCDNINSLLKNYDIGLMNSVSEAFGRSTVEYMLASLCVIASDSGANTELITNEYEGILYRQGDSEDLKQKIIEIIKNRKQINYYGKNAKIRAEKNFLDTINADNVFHLYESMEIKDDFY